MNNYKSLFLMLFLALFITSCEDEFIDLEARDELPASLALNSIEGLEATMFQVLRTARNIYSSPEVCLYRQAGTDLVKAGTNLTDVSTGGMLGMHEYSAGLAPTSGEIEGIWNNYYTALDRCNRVIAATDVIVPISTVEENNLQRFKGQASAMKAFLYLELIRRFDHIPLSTLQEEGTEPSLDAPLQDKAVIYEEIISNCKTAIELLPTRAEAAAGVGSPSKGLANLLLAYAQMDLGNWAEAAAAAEALIADPSYELQPLDYIFGVEGGKAGEESNNEIIFSLLYDPNISGTGEEQFVSVMYTPLYDRINGVLRTMETGGRAWSRYSPSDYYWSLFDEEDGRLQAWHKLQWTFDDPDNLPPGVELGDPVTKQDVIDQFGEGAIQLRYIEPTTTKFWEDGTYNRTTGDAGGYRNILIHRYAEAFILGAEAQMRNGNMSRALELINVIRDRAYGDTNHRFTSLDEEILLEEQARELGHEGQRWATLKRLGLLVTRVQQYNPNGGPNIQAKHVRWPIPQSFVDLAGVEQNEGY